MVEIGKYYRMTRNCYSGFRFYVKDINYFEDNSIRYLYSIYYDGSSEYYDSTISNHDFWNEGNFKEITVDEFIIDYKGTNPLPVTSDIFHALLF